MSLQQLQDAASSAAQHARNLHTRTAQQAQSEGRAITANEQAVLEQALREAQAAQRRFESAGRDQSAIDSINGALNGHGTTPVVSRGFGRQTLGEQFVASESYGWWQRQRASLSERWQSPVSELGGGISLSAATLSESTSGVGGAALILPDVRGGITSGATPRLWASQLLANSNLDGNSVSFLREKSFTNAADMVVEGAAKPESTLVLENIVEGVRKIAHWLPTTEEMMEDLGGLAGYIDARLRSGVLGKLDDEVLNGSGTAPHLTGLLQNPGLAPPVSVTTGVTAADAILTQIATIEATTGAVVDGLVINPLDWLAITLVKTSTGEYVGQSPFDPVTGTPTLWGRRIASTNTIAQGVALVGAFGSGAQLFFRGALRVDVSNSHSDFFVRNLLAIRAELRAALATYSPEQFGTVDLTTTP